MKEDIKDAIIISGLLLGVVGVLVPVWLSNFELDNSTMSKMIISMLVILAILFVFVFTGQNKKKR